MASPVCVATSPAVAMVRMPVTKLSGALGIGTGSQRNCPRLTTPGTISGAERQ